MHLPRPKPGPKPATSRLDRQALKAQAGPRAPGNKTHKVHRMVGLLQEHPEGLSIPQMGAQLGVHPRTIKRYLSDIRKWDYDLLCEPGGHGRSLYSIKKAETLPSHFLPVLKKIRGELLAGGNPRYTRAIGQLIQHLEREGRAGAEAEEPQMDVYYVDHGPFAEANPPVGILKILEQAIAARTAVRLSYSGYGRGKEEVAFYPYQLCLRVGTLYLIGREGANSGPFKSLSVRRIRRCLAGRETFARAPFDIREYYKYCFGQWARQLDEKPERALFRLDAPWLERYLSESHFHPPGRLSRRGKDLLFEVQIVIKPDFVNWVLSLAPDLVPLEPESLRRALSERLARGLAVLGRA